jgi:hypothetical protein
MYLLTRLKDGTTIHAIPRPEHGVFERLHDVTHSLIAEAIGVPSPTLARVAHGHDLDLDIVRLEEAAVLAITAYLEATHTPS